MHSFVVNVTRSFLPIGGSNNNRHLQVRKVLLHEFRHSTSDNFTGSRMLSECPKLRCDVKDRRCKTMAPGPSACELNLGPADKFRTDIVKSEDVDTNRCPARQSRAGHDPNLLNCVRAHGLLLGVPLQLSLL